MKQENEDIDWWKCSEREFPEWDDEFLVWERGPIRVFHRHGVLFELFSGRKISKSDVTHWRVKLENPNE